MVEVYNETSFSRRLPTKCFKKYLRDVLGTDDRFKELHEYIAKYPYALDQAVKSFDRLAELSHGLDYTDYKNRPDSTYDWSKFERPVPEPIVMEQAAIAYLYYRVYYSRLFGQTP